MTSLGKTAQLQKVPRVSRLCPNCGTPVVPLTEQICDRLRVPATPTELAALLGKPVPWIRASLHTLKQAGKVKQLDRSVPSQGKRGRRLERLWERDA